MIIKSSFLLFSLRVNRSHCTHGSVIIMKQFSLFWLTAGRRRLSLMRVTLTLITSSSLQFCFVFFFRINFDIWPPIFTELLTDLIAQVQFCCPILWKKILLSYTDICHPISEYRDFDLLIACKNIQNSRLLKAIFFLNKDIRLFFATNWLIWGSKEILLVLNLLAVMSCLFHVVCVGP